MLSRAHARPECSVITPARVAGDRQIATFLAYVCSAKHVMLDRELYPPSSWTVARHRRRAAGADELGFTTKPDSEQALAALPRTKRSKAHSGPSEP